MMALMLLPLATKRVLPRSAWVTFALAGAGAAFGALTLAGTAAALGRWTFEPAWTPWSALTLLATPFVPATIAHVVVNTIFVLVAGRALEWRVGRLSLLGLYWASGLAGLAAAAVLAPGPHAGSTGAVAGLMGASLVLLRRERFRVFYWLLLLWGTFELTTARFLVLWAASLVAVLATEHALDPSAAAGIAAGFLSGVAFGAVAALPAFKPARVLEEERRERETEVVGPVRPSRTFSRLASPDPAKKNAHDWW